FDKDRFESNEHRRPQLDGRVRKELWTHMLWGYRVGRYLLATHRWSPSADPDAGSYDASDVISYVDQSYQLQDVADLLRSPDLSAALHYHPVSSGLRRACGEDKAQARALVTLMEDLGFLTAVGAEDLSGWSTIDIDETRPRA